MPKTNKFYVKNIKKQNITIEEEIDNEINKISDL